MNFPGFDFLLQQVAALEAIGKTRLQHSQPDYLKHENKRMLECADAFETSRQLAKYGVPYEEPK